MRYSIKLSLLIYSHLPKVISEWYLDLDIYEISVLQYTHTTFILISMTILSLLMIQLNLIIY